MTENLSARATNFAKFLPSISTFYSTYIGRQRFEEYIPKSRMPSNLPDMENFNFLNPNEGAFFYGDALYSPGHANLDLGFDPKEDMIRNRHPDTWLLGDSGGYQIGKGVWEGDWKDINCPKASKKRDQVLAWAENYMDYNIAMDIPTWVIREEKSREATKINSYSEAVAGTKINYEWWIRNRTGKCKFLNVLQGNNHTEAEDWYQKIKEFCDPKIYPNEHFNGWAMGGQHVADPHLFIHRIVQMAQDGLLEPGKHDVIHFLGLSKLEFACLLTDLQNSIRKYINPNMTITYDAASPFLATANGQIYTSNRMNDREKWTYRMSAAPDDKKYHNDHRLYADVAVNDGKLPDFVDSPITKGLKISDICVYGPGDLNKIGKEGKTSWDSFAYAIMMANNVYKHCEATIVANEEYNKGIVPAMLVHELHHQTFFRDAIDEIMANAATSKAYDLINKHERLWRQIIGQRGYTGKKTINSTTKFKDLFT